MARKTINFEREKLYEEVWAEPVTKVAAKYGLSDVGLKKICKKLSIPCPPLGYWARLQHGKNPPRAALPKSSGPTVYQHSKYEPYVDEEVAERLAVVEAATPPPQLAARIEVRASVEECLPVVRQLGKELKGKGRDSREWPVTAANGAFVLAVSVDHSVRALLLADLVLRYCIQAKYSLERPQQGAAHIKVESEKFRFRISEKSLRVERKPSPEEKDDARRYPTIYGNRVYYTTKPTGMLRLDVMRLDSSYPIFSLRDGKTKGIEDSMPELPSKLQEFATKAIVERQLANEREQQREIRRAEQARLDEIRDGALEKLKKVEKSVADWGRAQRLRAFAAALQSSDTVEDEGLVAWTLRAADWVDPLVQGPWPEVDDANGKSD
jgi:hypothetical protein